MTDHPIPDDPVAKLTSATDDPGRFVNRGETLGVPCEPLCEWQARAALIALAEWADGALIDPNGWRRLNLIQYVNGIELCIIHDEVQIETHDPMGDCADHPHQCATVAIYTLTERVGHVDAG